MTAAPLRVMIEAEMKPFTAAMAQVRQEAAAAGNASAAAFTAAEEKIRRLPGGLNAAAAATKLTSGQVQNLGYQLNDVVSGLLMGQSPFTIMTQQGGQVVQALGQGPGGVGGSLKALALSAVGLATPLRLAGAAALAAGGALVYFASQGGTKVKPLNEAMEAHRKIIQGIASQYGIALEAKKNYESGSTQAFQLRQSVDELQLSGRTSLTDAGFAGGGDMTRVRRTDDGGRTYSARSGYEAFEGPLVKLAQGLKTGTDDAREFVTEVARIANLDPANDALRKTATELVTLAKSGADARDQIDLLTNSLASAKRSAATSRFDDASSTLRGLAPDTVTDREGARRAYQATIGSINALPGSDKQLDRDSLRATAARQYQGVLTEIGRQEENLRQGRELDMRSIFVRTAGERTNITEARSKMGDLEQETKP